MSQSVLPESWMHRATAYELLSLAFLLPTREVAEALVAGEFAAACDETFNALGLDDGVVAEAVCMMRECEGSDAEEVFRALRREHTRLYIGEKFPPVTPYVGVWAAQQRGQQGLLFVGRETMDIERFMLRCGVAKNLAAGQTNDPVDHIGTVCEFLKFLCLVNARALQAPENASIEEGDFEKFIADHLVDYARWCSEQTVELTRLSFFRAAAMLLDGTVVLSVPAE